MSGVGQACTATFANSSRLVIPTYVRRTQPFQPFHVTTRRGALNGTAAEYQNNNFRAASVATYASVYGWIYILHEADAGLLYLSGFSSPLRNITRSPMDAGSELFFVVAVQSSIQDSRNSIDDEWCAHPLTPSHLLSVETDDAYTLWVGKGPSAPVKEAENAARQACLSEAAVRAQLHGFVHGLNKALVSEGGGHTRMMMHCS